MTTRTLNNSVKGTYMSPIFQKDAFSRIDEKDDRKFYARDRFVSHLDSLALKTVRTLIGELTIEENPIILDLMASWDSHIPETLNPSKVVGIGLNENELKQNEMLTEAIYHDLNKRPVLPFTDNVFDLVINTVSVDYMLHPIDVFKEVGRTLKPGGLFLVIFSNRMFPEKAVKVWREASEEERILLVEEYFRLSEMFEPSRFFVSKNKVRPNDDKYARLGVPSDPVYAIYAEKKGGSPSRKKRPNVTMTYGERPDEKILKIREQRVKETLQCPHCNENLKKWAVPDNPFCQTWDNDFMYICFNDQCPYFIRGWDQMYRETTQSMSYRLMYNPVNNRCSPIPVPTPRALKDGIVG